MRSFNISMLRFDEVHAAFSRVGPCAVPHDMASEGMPWHGANLNPPTGCAVGGKRRGLEYVVSPVIRGIED